jgi:small subunit ribosomal protein S18
MQQQNNQRSFNNNSFRPMNGMGSLYPMQMGNNLPGQRNNQQQRRVEKKRPNPFGDTSLKTIDYLDGKALLKFSNDQGKILPKRINGTTAYQQRQVAKAIKYARHLALLPFVAQDIS